MEARCVAVPRRACGLKVRRLTVQYYKYDTLSYTVLHVYQAPPLLRNYSVTVTTRPATSLPPSATSLPPSAIAAGERPLASVSSRRIEAAGRWGGELRY